MPRNSFVKRFTLVLINNNTNNSNKIAVVPYACQVLYGAVHRIFLELLKCVH